MVEMERTRVLLAIAAVMTAVFSLVLLKRLFSLVRVSARLSFVVLIVILALFAWWRMQSPADTQPLSAPTFQTDRGSGLTR